MSKEEAWTQEQSESSGHPEGSTARREADADVQVDGQQRKSQGKRRRQHSQPRQLVEDGQRGTPGHTGSADSGVPARNAAGARVRLQDAEDERPGEVKYPVNFSTGPSVSVDGTLIVRKP